MQTARDIAADVRSGVTTALDTARASLARIESSDFNAVVGIDADRTFADARTVDRRVACGETLPLAGVPLVVKDNIFVAHRRVTQGSRLFADFVAPCDAIAVARLRQAGAVVVGMGNTSEFACKGVTTNPVHGPTRHPLDPALTPGGSSGGPAVAVAAGLVPLAIGTDAGGSSRRPAAHVGVVGFKPTFGAIPYGPGFEEPTFGLSVIAPIAHTVADAALAFEAMAGAHPADPDSVLVDPHGDSSALRVAWSPMFGLDVAVDTDVADGVAAAVEALRARYSIRPHDPVLPDNAREDALMPLQHAGLAALYGDAFTRNPDIFDPDIARQIENGLRLSGADVMRAQAASVNVARAMATLFADVDILLCPTVPCVAWPLDQLGPPMIGGKPASPRAHAAFTPFVNHAKVPALNLPCGTDRNGLPFGLQIIAWRGRDRMLLRFAQHCEEVLAHSP